jgi:hypothetical protein
MEEGVRPTSATAWLKRAGSKPAEEAVEPGLFQPPGVAAQGGDGQFHDVRKEDRLAATAAIIEAERAAVAGLGESTKSPTFNQADVAAALSMRPTWDTDAPAALPSAPSPAPIQAPTTQHPYQPATQGMAQPVVHAAPTHAAQPVVHAAPTHAAPTHAAPSSEPQLSRTALSPRGEAKRVRQADAPLRRGFFRRPAVVLEEQPSPPTIVNPALLPPPVLHRNTTAGLGPTERQRRKATKAARRSGVSATAIENLTMVVDSRSLQQKYREIPFIVPLVPAFLLSIGCSWAWMQGVIRLQGEMPWVPIFIGVLAGWVMRLGARKSDGGRIISAVVVTTFATLLGESTLERMRPFTASSRNLIEWGTLPAFDSPIVMVNLFHKSMEEGFLIGGLMILGPVVAGIVSSLDL